MTDDKPTHDLNAIKQAIAEGNFEIGNEAFKRGIGSVVPLAGEPGVIVLQWSRQGVGFGEIALSVRDGKLVIDSECMSRAFVIDVLVQAVREADVE